MTREPTGPIAFADLFTRAFRTPGSSNRYAEPPPDTPKAQRSRRELAPVPALTDPIGMLGHAPRPRKRRR